MTLLDPAAGYLRGIATCVSRSWMQQDPWRVAVQEVVGDESDACANSTGRVVWDQSQAGLQQIDESKQAVSRVASLCKSGHAENIDWISNHDGLDARHPSGSITAPFQAILVASQKGDAM